ncbi:LysR family transcriptional regulator [Massilia sp. MB5]|uniref:LysR family transcriptional regulator n=1 Tax=unclassified Massilia TaxID=2609279 RepID=UPI00067B3FA8|nr:MULTISPECIES: LysR family transcriptional regulator [unclassified Massilia]AKU23995.1 transcriptional regulator [Massilia sp. NR 4-1]UMR31049.1 LysR family transcriptional regulator [Massilia sp. MB5]
MDRLKAMHTFVRIVEANSFTKAAATLDLPRASLTATIQQLEAYLGTRLLQRTTRTLALTSDGTAYLRQCQAILAAVDEAEAPFRASAERPRGKLRIELPGTLGRNWVVPRLGEFHRAYPEIELVLGLGDRLVDLTREGIDCAIRVGELQDSAMVARRIGNMRFLTCAAPAYLAVHGTPATLDELARHNAVLHYSGRTGRPFPWEFLVDGAVQRIDMRGAVAVNDADAYLSCGLQGLGLIQPGAYLVRGHLARGELVALLADTPPTSLPISLVYPQGRPVTPKLQVFTAWAATLFETEPGLCADGAALSTDK